MSFLSSPIRLDDLPDHESTGEFKPLPDGEYPVTIEAANLKETAKGGEMISLKLKVFGTSFENRVLFSNLNIVNSNPTAQSIGLGQLKDIMRAIHLNELTHLDQFVGGQMIVKVATKIDKTYGEQNEIKAYKAIGNSPAPAIKTASSAPTAPWQR